jgi:hypothetical protein
VVCRQRVETGDVDARNVAHIEHAGRVVVVDVVSAEELVDEAVCRECGKIGFRDNVLEAGGKRTEDPRRADY